MIIACENCKAKYLVTPSSLGVQGRSVKCAKCNNTWFAKPDLEEIIKIEKTINESKPALKAENFKLPVIAKKRVPIFLKVIPVILLLLIMVSSSIFFPEFVSKVPVFRDFYVKLGAFSTEGLSLQDIAIRKIETISGKNLLIRGAVYNASNKNKQIPHIRLIFYTKEEETLKIIEVPLQVGFIKAGENYELSYTISPLSERAEFIKLEFGNKLELFLR